MSDRLLSSNDPTTVDTLLSAGGRNAAFGRLLCTDVGNVLAAWIADERSRGTSPQDVFYGLIKLAVGHVGAIMEICDADGENDADGIREATTDFSGMLGSLMKSIRAANKAEAGTHG